MARLRSANGNPLAGLQQTMARVHLAKEVALEAVALVLVRQIKLMLSRPGQGKLRRRGIIRRGRARMAGVRGAPRSSIGGLGRASAPGDPPAMDTGALRNSINHQHQMLHHVVGTNSEYAAPLEFGANLRNGGKILPRPFMRPAVREAEREMNAVMVGVLKSGT